MAKNIVSISSEIPDTGILVPEDKLIIDVTCGLRIIDQTLKFNKRLKLRANTTYRLQILIPSFFKVCKTLLLIPDNCDVYCGKYGVALSGITCDHDINVLAACECIQIIKDEGGNWKISITIPSVCKDVWYQTFLLNMSTIKPGCHLLLKSTEDDPVITCIDIDACYIINKKKCENKCDH
jgi:hypothetical protein